MRYADLHCDLLSKINSSDDWTKDNLRFHLTPDGVSSGIFLQTFAVFANNNDATMSVFYKKYDLFCRIRKKLEFSGMVCVFSVENGAFLEGEIANVKRMEKCGVRFLTLTWNGGNALSGAHDTGGGLTGFGKEICERLFAGRKILPDVSHLSDKGIEEVCAMAKDCGGTVVATHSGSRALCNHSRNLTDGQIRKIADSGGVVGVPFYLPFLGGYAPAAHAAHIIKVGGEGCAAIGSDFDGMDKSYYPDPVAAAKNMQRSLEKVGLSARQIEKVLQKNALRVSSLPY